MPVALHSLRKSSRLRRPQRAFSLLEMIVVLAVLAGLMALAWPSLNRPLRGSDAQRAAATLREQLAVARQQALRDGELVLVRLRGGQDEIEWGNWRGLIAETLSAESGLPRPMAAEDSAGQLRSWSLPGGVVVEGVRLVSLPSDPAEQTADAVSAVPGAFSNVDGGNARSATASAIDAGGDTPAPQDSGDREAVGANDRWYLPFLPNGETRAAEIVLRDPLSGARVLVSIDAVTGMMRSEKLRPASAEAGAGQPLSSQSTAPTENASRAGAASAAASSTGVEP